MVNIIQNKKTGSSAAVWDSVANSYDTFRQEDPVYFSCIRQTVNPVPKGSSLCLDAGCGTGLSSTVLSSRCNLVVAADYSFNSLKILKQKKLCNVVAVLADLTSLPFKDSVFDACVCANTLQHLKPDGPQKIAVAELHRVSKKNGILSCSVHHFSRCKRKSGWIKEGKPGQPGIDYIFRFSRNDLLAIIPGSQVKSVGYYGLLRIPFFGSRSQDFIAKFFGQVLALLGFGHMLIAVTSKFSRYMKSP